MFQYTGDTRTSRVIAIWDKELAKSNGIGGSPAAADYLKCIIKQNVATKFYTKFPFASKYQLLLFSNYALGVSLSEGFTDLGPPRWRLVLCFLTAWIIVCVCLIQSVKSSGKVQYVNV